MVTIDVDDYETIDIKGDDDLQLRITKKNIGFIIELLTHDIEFEKNHYYEDMIKKIK